MKEKPDSWPREGGTEGKEMRSGDLDARMGGRQMGVCDCTSKLPVVVSTASAHLDKAVVRRGKLI